MTKIFSELSRSRTVINNYLRSPTTYGTRKPNGRPRTISAVAFRKINRSMSKNPKSVRTIAADIPFKLSHQTILRVLFREDRFTYLRLQKTICHTTDHKVKRVLWAMDHIGRKSEWSKVIFLDENKFNFDGSDGIKHYLHDLRQSRKYFSVDISTDVSL